MRQFAGFCQCSPDTRERTLDQYWFQRPNVALSVVSIKWEQASITRRACGCSYHGFLPTLVVF